MKSKYSFEIMELDDGLVAVPVGKNAVEFQGVMKVNETAADIIKLLENDTTEEQILDSIMQQYTGDRVQIARYIHEYVDTLIKEGVVE